MRVSVSPSLENYLKVILQLQEDGNAARITDLAERLSVAKSSANQAVKLLKDQGLVKHEKYGQLELTERGSALAREISKRHEVLMSFLVDVLKVDLATAENDACLMEHAISPATMEKLSSYVEQQLGYPLEEEQPSGEKAKSGMKILKKLDAVLPGTRARVVKLTSKGALGHRLMEMGIMPGTEILVEAYAPMGDPIEIKVCGYSLAIRKAEASNVLVELIL